MQFGETTRKTISGAAFAVFALTLPGTPLTGQAEARDDTAGRLAQLQQLPPPRPADLVSDRRDLPPPPPGVVGIAPGSDPSQAPAAGNNATLGTEQVVARANDYFNGLTTLYATFIQVNANGDRLTGQLYLHRPGRLRFDYDPPATMQVIADGRQVAIKDNSLSTQDVYPINQTPLKFLLNSRVRLGRDVRVLGAEQHDDEIDLHLEDSSTLGGTSQIALTFDETMGTLKRWRIRDPQGFITTVALDDIDRRSRLDPNMFTIMRDMPGG